MNKIGVLLLLLIGPTSLYGQLLHASTPLPSFAVASIRLSGPSDQHKSTVRPDMYEAQASTIKELIQYAYGIQFDGELSGGPGWIGTDKFTIQAKPNDAEIEALKKLSVDDLDEQMRLRVQSLLADRFHLDMSFSKKNLPVYVLMIAKDGFKCTVDSSHPVLANSARPRIGWSAAPAPPPPPPGYVPPMPDEQARVQQRQHIRTKGWPFWLVVTVLSHQPELGGRAVIDKTGLDGFYDCEATWARVGSDTAMPSFFTAIQEAMGLKLQPGKEPVEVLTVKRIERPSPN